MKTQTELKKDIEEVKGGILLLNNTNPKDRKHDFLMKVSEMMHLQEELESQLSILKQASAEEVEFLKTTRKFGSVTAIHLMIEERIKKLSEEKK